MCGIAGILTRRETLAIEPPLSAMLRAVQHRGPDDQGIKVLDLPGNLRLGLAHARLSVIDVTVSGRQPMEDPDSGSWITYNGEVYNHQDIRKQLPASHFRGGSDTETILKSWAAHGDQALSEFRGMFAFGLYDGRRRQFWLVRDRLGVKPLYVCRADESTWLFASELRAILATGLVPRRLDSRAVNSYFALGAVPAPWTLVEGVQSLLPGEAWKFELDAPSRALEPRRRSYWQAPFCLAARPPMKRAEAIEQLRPVLREAAALRMVSDVPLGVFLSGGIDSSSVVALLASQGYALRTFSVAFKEQRFNESHHAREIARVFGTEHMELSLPSADIQKNLDETLEAYDQPSIDGLNTYFIAKATRSLGLKVCVSGLGGDELFGGYPYFRYLSRLDSRFTRGAAAVIHQVLRRLAPGQMRTIKLGGLLDPRRSRLQRYLTCRAVMPPDRRSLLQNADESLDLLPLPAELAADLEAEAADLDTVNAYSMFEMSLYLGNMLLRDTDQMSMAHGLEVREPLLDHRLVETVAQVPGALKMAPGNYSRIKGLLTDSLPVQLPPQAIQRRKMGFVFPWDAWLRNELKPRVDAVFSDQATLADAGLNPGGVNAIWQGYLAAKPGLRSSDVLAMLNFLVWVARNGMSLGCEANSRGCNRHSLPFDTGPA